MTNLIKIIKKIFNSKNNKNVIFAAFSQINQVNRAGPKVDNIRSKYIVRQNKFPKDSKLKNQKVSLKYEDDVYPKKKNCKITKKVTVSFLNNEDNDLFSIESIEKDIIKRLKKSIYLSSKNLIELNTFDQAAIIQSCHKKLTNNEFNLVQNLSNSIYKDYKLEVEFECLRLNIQNYKDFEIPFEKNLEIINSILNLQNYYIEKYNLKSLKKKEKE